MKDKDITAINVDDFVREKKKAGAKFIRWGKNGAKHWRNFVVASWPREYGIAYPKTIHGLTYMGIKHYIL